MPTPTRHILALGGGGFLMEPAPALDDYALRLSRTKSPRVCLLATGSGDNPAVIERFYQAFPPSRARASHLTLFRTENARPAPADALLQQDVIYVSGGNTANLLALWRLHRLDRALRRAWTSGVVLAGVSAGMLCWFDDGVTDSFGRPLHALSDRGVAGLGLLPGAACPHYDGEPDRRRAFHALIQRTRQPGLAADDGCALHFIGKTLHRTVASRPNAAAYRVRLTRGRIIETRLPADRP